MIQLRIILKVCDGILCDFVYCSHIVPRRRTSLKRVVMKCTKNIIVTVCIVIMQELSEFVPIPAFSFPIFIGEDAISVRVQKIENLPLCRHRFRSLKLTAKQHCNSKGIKHHIVKMGRLMTFIKGNDMVKGLPFIKTKLYTIDQVGGRRHDMPFSIEYFNVYLALHRQKHYRGVPVENVVCIAMDTHGVQSIRDTTMTLTIRHPQAVSVLTGFMYTDRKNNKNLKE